MGPFRPGIGFLVAGTDLPVVPCALTGAFAAMPRSAFWPRPREIRLVIGPPRRFAHLPAGKESAYAIARQLQDAIQELA
jgi:1-acyl-sn-glycerol-3-phosphate acyltransferase